MQFFYEIFNSSLPRLGPGDDAYTLKALEMLLSAKEQSKGIPVQPNLSVLAMCFYLLAKYGQLAVSELCWHRPDPPTACRNFFTEEYPAIVDTATNVETIRQCGYELLGHFPLPASAWIEN